MKLRQAKKIVRHGNPWRRNGAWQKALAIYRRRIPMFEYKPTDPSLETPAMRRYFKKVAKQVQKNLRHEVTRAKADMLVYGCAVISDDLSARLGIPPFNP